MSYRKALPEWAQKAERDFHGAVLVKIIQDVDKKDCSSFAFLCYFDHFDHSFRERDVCLLGIYRDDK